MTTVRELLPIRVLGHALTVWSALFAIVMLAGGSKVTTQQWLYLFSVPGGFYSWVAIFAGAGILSCTGLWTRRYRVASTGQFLMGTGCLSVALLYLFAPVFGNEMVTLGFTPWLLDAFLMYFLTVTNWSETAWAKEDSE